MSTSFVQSLKSLCYFCCMAGCTFVSPVVTGLIAMVWFMDRWSWAKHYSPTDRKKRRRNAAITAITVVVVCCFLTGFIPPLASPKAGIPSLVLAVSLLGIGALGLIGITRLKGGSIMEGW